MSKGNYGRCFWKYCAHDVGETFSRVVIFSKSGRGNGAYQSRVAIETENTPYTRHGEKSRRQISNR